MQKLGSVQFSSLTQSWLTHCDPMDCSLPGFPVLHQLPELAQTHVHQVSDAIQPSHPLSPPSSPAFSLSQHQGIFQWVSSSHQVANVFSFSIRPTNEYSGNRFPLGLTGFIYLQSKEISRGLSNTMVQNHPFFGAQSSLWSNSHIHKRLLKKHSFDYTDLGWQSNVSAF